MDVHEKEKYLRILDWFEGKKRGPFKIDLELHRRCNSRCLSCSRRADPNYERINEYSAKVEMPLSKWMEIVEEAAKLNVREWHIAGGGEPMFLPQTTLPVMSKIKEFGMLGIITTNGTLWREGHVRRTVEMGWDRVHLSIDAPDARTHDYLRGVPGTFKRVLRTIGLFHKFKKICGSSKPMLNINMVLSVPNYKKLPKMVEFAHRHGIEYLFVDPLIVYSQLGEKLKLRPRHLTEFARILKEARELAKKLGIGTNFTGLEQNLTRELIMKSSQMHQVVKSDTERMREVSIDRSLKDFLVTPCYKPWWHMTIKCDGRTTSCDVPVTGGDDIRTKRLIEVWEGSYFNDLRKRLRDGEVPEFCAQCNPSHTAQRRRLRLEIARMIEPELFDRIKDLWVS
jgi:MoaA/NifB/PqqE/SkfB family radical SAM enzyme